MYRSKHKTNFAVLTFLILFQHIAAVEKNFLGNDQVGWDVMLGQDIKSEVGKACEITNTYKKGDSCYAGCKHEYINRDVLRYQLFPIKGLLEVNMKPYVKYKFSGTTWEPEQNLVCVKNPLYDPESSDQLYNKKDKLSPEEFMKITQFTKKLQKEKQDVTKKVTHVVFTGGECGGKTTM
jgi:hypothetical protein